MAYVQKLYARAGTYHEALQRMDTHHAALSKHVLHLMKHIRGMHMPEPVKPVRRSLTPLSCEPRGRDPVGHPAKWPRANRCASVPPPARSPFEVCPGSQGDRVARGISLSKAPRQQSKATPVYTDDSSEENDHPQRGRGPKPDPFSHRELCKSVMGTPAWDGCSLSRPSFVKEWRVYWEFQRDLLGSKVKKWIFIRCLPERWREHMKAQITDNNWGYKDIMAFMSKQCDIMVPDWKKLQAWRGCLPQGSSYLDFTHWWLHLASPL